MPMPRPVDSTLHGVVDYTAGGFLLTAFPRVAGIEGTRSARQIRTAAAIHAGYSTVTDYPLGIVKLLPYRAHLAVDASAFFDAATWRRLCAVKATYDPQDVFRGNHRIPLSEGVAAVRRAA